MENTIENKKENNIKANENEPNKTPYWTMRAASGVIDTGLLIFLLFIFISVFRLTPLGDYRTGYRTEMASIEKDYALKPLVEGSDVTLGYKEYITDENKEKYESYIKYEDESKQEYVVLNSKIEDEELLKQLKEAYSSQLKKNETYKAAKFNYQLVDYGINMIAAAVSEAILILVVPLLMKKRSTIGQYIGGIMLVNAKIPTPAKWWKIVIRYFWVTIVEVALPCLGFMSIYSVVFVPLILYVISLFNKNKRTLRDYVSSTRFIETKSYQKIRHEDD